MKRYALSLVEVLIAASIMAILAGALLTTLKRFALLNKKTNEAHILVLKRKQVQERLTPLFSQILSATQDPLYTEDGKLFFYFSNGIDHDKDFSFDVKGELSLQDETLFLTLYSLSDKEKVDRQPLLENVQSLEFCFADFQSEAKKERKQDEEMLPALISLSMTHHQKPLHYTFFLNSNSSGNLIYLKKPA
ncbi:MAG: prepilin-type N-terminal cleavage/methylation domain-containing protein [Simkaniaceae bacterium]